MGRTPSIIKKDKTVPVKVRIVPAAPPPPTVKPKPPRKPRAITREEWEKACKLFRKRNPLKRNKKELQVWENYGPFLLSDEAQKISKAFTGGKSQKDCFGRWLKKFDNLWSCTHDYPKPGEPTPDFPKVEWQLMAELESCCRAKDGFTCHCGGLFVDNAYGTKDPMSRRDIGRKAQSIAAKMDGTDKFVGSDGFAREFKKRMEVIHQNEISSRGKYETIFFRAPIGTKEELNEVIEFTKKHSSERLESYNDPYESKAGQAIPKHLFHSCQLLDEEATMAHLKGKKDERRHIKPPTRAAGRGNKLETPSKIHVLPDGTPAQSLAKFYSLSHLPFLGKVAKICTDVFSHYFDGKRHHDADKNQLMSAFGNVEIHAAPAQEHMALFPKHTDKQAIWFPMVGVFVLQGKTTVFAVF